MNRKIETQLAQIGIKTDAKTGALGSPIYLSTTYQHPEFGQSTGFDYTRTNNPTRDVLEKAIATLEEGATGIATASGMSAVSLILELFEQGSHLLATRDLYGGSFRHFNRLEEKGALSFTYFQTEDEIYENIRENTKAIFIETPTNPMMQEYNIARIAKFAKSRNLLVIVDNTFLTPVYQKPLTLGADIVLHSATKYLSGHNDVLAGLVVTKEVELGEKLHGLFNEIGCVLSPLDSYLVMRGMKTLALRMAKHTENARKIVQFLQASPHVKEVIYPTSNLGGMISVKLKDAAHIPTILNHLKVFTFAESLGGVESLITYPVTQTHADIPKAQRESYGLTEDLLRLSIGIEHVEDLIQDLAQALEAKDF